MADDRILDPVRITYRARRYPVISIDIQNPAYLRSLLCAVRHMAVGPVSEIDITSCFPVVFVGVDGLLIRRLPDGTYRYYQSVSRTIHEGGRLVLCWSETADIWHDHEGLIEGLLASRRGGHQVFNEDPSGLPGSPDAEIVLSFREDLRTKLQ